jgi:glycyl-tRNA synthetase beta chain
MADFLLELLSEEIPARMQDKARADLARLFEAEIGKAGLKAEALETYATPRRLVLIARGLPAETAAVREETKGPRASAPPQALEGFLRKTGLARDQLEERDGILFAVVEKAGRPTGGVLAEAIPAIIRSFPWPKSMRWGEGSASTESLRWVRPLQGIVALLGEEIVDLEIAGIRSGAATVGHRFHHAGAITIGSANDYTEKLQACHVIVDQEERKRIIRDGAAAVAAGAGFTLVPDEALVAENAGLTEWPVPLLGRFDPAYLDVPGEVIQLTMRTNQKYFALLSPPRNGEGDQPKAGGGADGAGIGPATTGFAGGPPPRSGEEKLAPNFLCTANIVAADGGAAIVAGNERVLSARLADAKFFWEQDLKVPLEDQARKLSQIVFHEKLGTLADKVDRVAKLARWLVEEGIVRSPLPPAGGAGGGAVGSSAKPFSNNPSPNPSRAREGSELAVLAERAARLCKADLVTQMVGEFPELQGIIGGHLARAQGEDPAVADAIRDHYGLSAHGPVSVSLALADKLDTVLSFFSIGERPTGSRDPYALRRAGLGALYLILQRGLRLQLNEIASRDVIDFLIDRWKFQNREAGGRPDLIDAVVATTSDGDLGRLGARLVALQAFVETPEGADLLAGYKRAANILRKEGWASPVAPAKAGAPAGEERGADAARDTGSAANPAGVPASAGTTVASTPDQKTLSYTPEDEEQRMIAALDSVEREARAAVEAEDFEGAMAALASLRAPVDSFFDKVTVNDPDPAKRDARLALLARIRDAVHLVADFSRIEG